MDTPLLSNVEGRTKTEGAMVGTAAGGSDEELGMPAAQVPDLPPVRSLRDAWEVLVGESKRLWPIAVPITLGVLCLYGLNSTTQIFVGHLGNLQLSAAAISLSVVSMFSFGFLFGMGSALETLCGQAFGAGRVDMLGIYLQRSWIILIVSSILLCPIYIFATPILKLLGQDDEIAELAGKFTVSIIPQMFAMAINFPTQKFLQAQRKVVVIAWIGVVGLFIHVGLLALFIFVFEWGMGGAAAAFDISSWMVAIAQIVYVVGWCRDAWTGLSSSAFKDIWPFVRLSLGSAVMICLEVWYMMVLVVLTGHLGNAQIAVGSISICMNINGWEAMIFIGINAATSVRVSNELGSGRPRATKIAVIVVVLESLAIGILAMIVILVTRNYFSIIFTSNKELQRAVASIAYLLSITMVLNSVQPVISGVAVGGGWQTLVAYINLGCYYVLGLPLGFLLGYRLHWGVQGIWAGMICGTAVQTLILLLIVWKTDWKAESGKASRGSIPASSSQMVITNMGSQLVLASFVITERNIAIAITGVHTKVSSRRITITSHISFWVNLQHVQETRYPGSGQPPSDETESATTVVQDYPAIKGTKDVLELFTTESKRLWRIAAPIIFNIICLYAINSTTQIFSSPRLASVSPSYQTSLLVFLWAWAVHSRLSADNLRSWSVGHARHLLAALVDHPRCLFHPSAPTVYIFNPHPQVSRPGG